MVNKIRLIIVDDEPYARKGLRKLLADEKDIQIIHECSNGKEAILAINKLRPDLVFLDIQMPGFNGFQVLKHLTVTPVIIFITAYDKFAIRAFEVNALDYLVKPFSDKRFRSTIARTRNHIKTKTNSELNRKILSLINEHINPEASPGPENGCGKIRDDGMEYIDKIMTKRMGEIFFVDVDEIIWIQAMDYYSKIFTVNGSYLIRESMKNLEQRLDPNMFVRPHRSAIVKKSEIKSLNFHSPQNNTMLLKDGTEVKVARSKKSFLRNNLS